MEIISVDAEAPPPEVPVEVFVFPREEQERIRNMVLQFTYIKTVDKQYTDAMHHLMNCESIGLLGGPTGRETLEPIALLVLSAWDKVYAFEGVLFQFPQFHVDLKELLESGIRIVVGDSWWLLNCLSFMYHIHVRNVFDVQVADALIERVKTPGKPDTFRYIPDLFSIYLNVPDTNLPLGCLQIITQDCSELPITYFLLLHVAHRAGYLITLKNRLQCIMNQYDKKNWEKFGWVVTDINDVEVRFLNCENVFK